MKRIYTYCLAIILMIPVLLSAQKTTAYQDSIVAWHQKRIQDLKAPDGWVNLVGLLWLNPGKNTFGSAKSNQLMYQHKDMPAQAGSFNWENGTVNWVSQKGVATKIKDSLMQEAILFSENSKEAPQIALGSLRWNLIKRESKIGIRLRDLNAPALKKFKAVPYYPIDMKYRVDAVLEKPVSNQLMITNVLGQTTAQETPGRLVFQINGITYKLDALDEGGDELFVIFGDATNEKETYPTGRFMYVPKPDATGHTVIDFNKAFNPPCAFTVHATCPLPPKQNILPIALKIGEKKFHPELLK
ncbi:MAG: hypothetical protein B7Y15_04075 [Bacteroidetes bacterium 24-39-8]|jgi:uncharacterized protein (DUF1684 family)|nr:MAG: hypothetical protein B7Y69_01175 [Sphingobacteriia bacterium 35-40-8]OYZ51981.1 MAG: hypothetical protein B7Y15_04075 [Bacteroidetes bacterium 24-39-8]OZA66546.1 MAG: hypothetical protein B7X72_06005 [Sphingobacteriia bacterium 39-39-8]HQR91848.1 DUF1684 domain-containing protein [Sediminibacterium sp.]